MMIGRTISSIWRALGPACLLVAGCIEVPRETPDHASPGAGSNGSAEVSGPPGHSPPPWLEQDPGPVTRSSRWTIPVGDDGAAAVWLGRASAEAAVAVLEVTGGTRPLELTLNGSDIGLHLGDLAPSSMAVSGRLVAGWNEIALVAVDSDETSLGVGRMDLPDRPPRLALRLAPATHVAGLRPRPSEDPANLPVAIDLVQAPPGSTVDLRLVLDGAVLSHGSAPVADGLAEVTLNVPLDQH